MTNPINEKWSVEKLDDLTKLVNKKEGKAFKGLVAVKLHSTYENKKEIERRFVLMSAAPDLYASLVELLPYATKAIKELNDQMVGSLYPSINLAMLDRAKKAIEKANGE